MMARTTTQCGTRIEYRKTGSGARGLYWCPRCQT
jgi:formamidopyrimidine-DNA glycosylase